MADKGKKPQRLAEQGFWHEPRQMETVANGLLLAAVVGLGYAASALLLTLPVFPLRELAVMTPLRQVTPAQIEYVALDSVAGNFFTVNLDRVRASFEKLPWVRRAEVRRRWPDGLEVVLEEQVAVAQWKQGASEDLHLVNPHGELFTAASREALPLLAGPPGRAADVLARYREFSKAVGPLEMPLAAVTLSSREAWTLRLGKAGSEGLTVELGREQSNAPVLQRLNRFVGAYRETGARLRAPVAMVDLRYPNGFAVRIKTRDVKEK